MCVNYEPAKIKLLSTYIFANAFIYQYINVIGQYQLINISVGLFYGNN